MPKVSVIIPTHNRVQYVGSAIQSVLAQTLRDFEIIVVDDGSSDGTAELVHQFNDGRLLYVQLETNKGAAAARNIGIGNSKSKYVAFLDDDDEWLPQKLELQIERMESCPARVGLVYTGYLAVERSTGEVVDVRRPVKRGDLSDELLRDNWVSSTSSVLIRRPCLDEVGLFDESLPSFQDYDLWIRLSRRFHVECIEEPLFKFFCHGDRIWTNLDALNRGMALMLSKYGKAAIIRRQFSYRYLYLGVRYCEAGESKKSRAAFLKAISLHPWEARHYLNLLLSLTGPSSFRRVKEAKAKLLDHLRVH